MFITCPKCSAKYKIPSEINFNEGKKLQCSACQNIFKFSLKDSKQDEPNKESLIPPEDAVLTITEQTEQIMIREKEPERKKNSLPEAFCPVKISSPKGKKNYFLICVCIVILFILALSGWVFRDLLWMDVPSSASQTRYARQIEKKKITSTVVPKQNLEKETKTDAVDSSSDIPLIFEQEPKKEDKSFTTDTSESKKNLSVGAVRFRKKQTGDAFLIEGVLKNTTQEIAELPEKVYALAYGSEGTVLFEKEIYLPKGVVQPGMEQAFFGTYTPIIEGVQWVDVILKD